MCKLCDPETGEEQSCQDCGRLICFDTKSFDDVCAPAYVTASGDLYCSRCGAAHDAEEEEEEDDDADRDEEYPV